MIRQAAPATQLRRFLLAALVLVPVVAARASDAAADAYRAWQAGDPATAAPALVAQARATDRWSAWLDAGLAAAAAGDRAHAIACLVAARRRAPERHEPRDALRALDAAPPPGWLDVLGPLAQPGLGWCGVALAAASGLAAATAVCGRRRRLRLIAGVALAIAVAPGQVAWWHDALRPLAVIVADTRLLDSAGNAGASVASGTLVEIERRAPWAGRRLVSTAAGAKGYVAEADLAAW